MIPRRGRLLHERCEWNFLVSITSAYRVGIRTHSADENAVLLLAGGKLVAILVELADEGHGDERGKWVIEMIFGVDHDRIPNSFPSSAQAATWMSTYVGGKPFMLKDYLVALA